RKFKQWKKDLNEQTRKSGAQLGSETRWVVFDVEGDSLTPTKIYCLSYKDYNGDSGTYTDYRDIRTFFTKYSVYVGHNIRRWDLPNLQRLVGIRPPTSGYKVVDTLGVA